MSKLAIFGAGGHGKVVAEAAMLSGKFNEIVFIDNTPNLIGKSVNGINVKFDSIESVDPNDFNVHVAIGDNRARLQIYNKISDLDFTLVNVIHPSSIISPNALLGDGIAIMANVVVQTNARIGNGVILNTGSIVEHDCKLANFVHLSPNSTLAGNVTVGESVWIGAGTVCREKTKISKGVVVGANSFVSKNLLKTNSTYFGSPAIFHE